MPSTYIYNHFSTPSLMNYFQSMQESLTIHITFATSLYLLYMICTLSGDIHYTSLDIVAILFYFCFLNAFHNKIHNYTNYLVFPPTTCPWHLYLRFLSFYFYCNIQNSWMIMTPAVVLHSLHDPRNSCVNNIQQTFCVVGNPVDV